MVVKLLKYLVISVSIRQIAQIYISAIEAEMVSIALDGINDCSNFAENVTDRELYEHHNKKLISTGEMLHLLITILSFNNAIKDSFRKKTNEFAEYVFTCIHACPTLMSEANMRNLFKSVCGCPVVFNYILISYKGLLKNLLDVSVKLLLIKIQHKYGEN